MRILASCVCLTNEKLKTVEYLMWDNKNTYKFLQPNGHLKYYYSVTVYKYTIIISYIAFSQYMVDII